MYDVARIRQDFPILSQPHPSGKPLVFLDSAASSQKPSVVIDAMTNYYRTQHANVHRGIYALSEAATHAYEAARDKVKSFINAEQREEIIFTSNTTGSINLIVQTWGRQNLENGDVVVLTAMEHHANIVPWQILAAEKGFQIKYIPVTSDYLLDLEVFERILSEGNVKAVSVGHVSNVLGTINPVEHIIERAHAFGAIAIVDGAQSVPHLPVDVQALDVDFYAFSGHKMCGPTGIGILYGKRHLLEAMPPWQGGGDMIARVTLEGATWNDLPYKFEAGTPAIAEAIGLGAAVDYLQGIGMEAIHQHEAELGVYARERLAEVEGVQCYNPAPPYASGVATFTLEGVHPHDLAQILDYEGVAVRAGHHCAMPLHREVLCIHASVRASFYLYSTREEVDTLIACLQVARQRFL
ncbi:MAG: cysteine desulfurase [Phototrophicales bacterium]|nr:MAG: cysteine desulfurase [Phototrophicales bacterium]